METLAKTAILDIVTDKLEVKTFDSFYTNRKNSANIDKAISHQIFVASSLKSER